MKRLRDLYNCILQRYRPYRFNNFIYLRDILEDYDWEFLLKEGDEYKEGLVKFKELVYVYNRFVSLYGLTETEKYLLRVTCLNKINPWTIM